MGQLDSSEARNMRDWETSFPTTVSCTFPGRQLLWEQGEVGAEGSPQPSFQRGLLPCPSRTQSWGTAMLDPAGSTGKRSHQQAREGRWQNGTLSPTAKGKGFAVDKQQLRAEPGSCPAGRGAAR